jgi:hypothetical protein
MIATPPSPARFRLWSGFFALACLTAFIEDAAAATALPVLHKVEAQPLLAQVRRLLEACDHLGTPLSVADKAELESAFALTSAEASVETVQRVLDKYCLVFVSINPEARVKASVGPAKPELLETGWRQFLIKVQNDAGTTAPLRCFSPEAQSVFEGVQLPRSPSDQEYGASSPAGNLPVPARWMNLLMADEQPMTRSLSGLALEYRIIQIYSRDAGAREATLRFDVGQGTQDLGFRSDLPILFDCRPAYPVKMRVRDENGSPTVAAFVIRDAQGRVYPSQAKRLAPDLAFQPQIYRADGETVRLAAGTYSIQCSRGPESLMKTQTLTVSETTREFGYQVERWIDPAKQGWWSGDHHIHAAGCLHYSRPTEGVRPEDMIRYVTGEDLKVGANLTWGPGFDYQKQFFCGRVDAVSRYPYLLRYDLEVSGFGSDQSGHLVLLRLKEQLYPGSQSTEGWPSLGLNTLRWGKKQGAVVGAAHSGWGLAVDDNELPSYQVPKFDSIGANEYIVDVTHEVPGPDGRLEPAVDFISTVDTHPAFELNIWYHTLNTGFRTRISGETDFPCINGDRVGMGRSYVKLDGPLNYDDWCQGIRLGRSYVSDGKSHLLGFKANQVAVGENGSEVKLAAPGSITLTVTAAALLADQPDPRLHGIGTVTGKWGSNLDKPYWDIERARIGDTREVSLEVVVNGYPVVSRKIPADGKSRDQAFEVKLERSSWVALRIMGSSHTNPIFVIVGEKPIRVSRRSVEWCLKSVDQCWSQKERFIKPAEMADAKFAYEHARQVYRARLKETETE